MGGFIFQLLVIAGVLTLHSISCSEFYSISAKDIKGNEVSMEKYRGKVVLIVNVASVCGFTDVNYRELVELQNKYLKKDLAILAFPCNQFGKQEPKRNSGIYRFAVDNYGANFDMFSKTNIIGSGAHPIYNYLVQESGFSPIWNFNKYLLNRGGFVVKVWDHNTNPWHLEKTVEQYVNSGTTNNFETVSIQEEL